MKNLPWNHPIRAYIRKCRDDAYLRDPHCHWCGKHVYKYKKTNVGADPKHDYATADHILSEWNPLRRNISELAQKIVLSCYDCNQRRADEDRELAYEKYPELERFREDERIALYIYHSYLSAESYRISDKIVLIDKHVLLDKSIFFMGGGTSWLNHAYLEELRSAQIIRMPNLIDNIDKILPGPSGKKYALNTGIAALSRLPRKKGLLVHYPRNEEDIFLFLLPLGQDQYYIQEFNLALNGVYCEWYHGRVRLYPTYNGREFETGAVDTLSFTVNKMVRLETKMTANVKVRCEESHARAVSILCVITSGLGMIMDQIGSLYLPNNQIIITYLQTKNKVISHIV